MKNGFDTGKLLKQYLNDNKINHRKIDDETLELAVKELMNALQIINGCKFDLDDFSECNNDVFDFEEAYKSQNDVYRALSLFAI